MVTCHEFIKKSRARENDAAVTMKILNIKKRTAAAQKFQ